MLRRVGHLRHVASRTGVRGFTTAAAAFSRQQASSTSARLIGFAALAGLGLATANLPRARADSVPIEGKPGTKYERTFIAVKPDGVQRGLVGKIIERFERRGYVLVAIKLVHPSLERAQEHYDDLKTKPFFPGLTKYFSSGPIVAMVWQGKDSIKTGRTLLGETNPLKSAPGTIRGDFCIDLGRNIIHGSDSPESARNEINLWFKDEEVTTWMPTGHNWVYESHSQSEGTHAHVIYHQWVPAKMQRRRLRQEHHEHEYHHHHHDHHQEIQS